MLTSLGKAAFWMRLGPRVFVCMPRQRMDDGLVARIRPLVVGGLACWFDRPARR
jgi:hypothetical protein